MRGRRRRRRGGGRKGVGIETAEEFFGPSVHVVEQRLHLYGQGAGTADVLAPIQYDGHDESSVGPRKPTAPKQRPQRIDVIHLRLRRLSMVLFRFENDDVQRVGNAVLALAVVEQREIVVERRQRLHAPLRRPSLVPLPIVCITMYIKVKQLFEVFVRDRFVRLLRSTRLVRLLRLLRFTRRVCSRGGHVRRHVASAADVVAVVGSGIIGVLSSMRMVRNGVETAGQFLIRQRGRHENRTWDFLLLLFDLMCSLPCSFYFPVVRFAFFLVVRRKGVGGMRFYLTK